MASFEAVADEYDTGRPGYPDGVFDALGTVSELVTLDVGAGTGIATRALIERGARVIALDPGREVLRRAELRTPSLRAVVADGARLPVRSETIDLICFAQSWHWLDEVRRIPEAHRVLRPGGRWAAWWSHARADDESWFDAYWTAIERTCPGTHRSQRDTDWGHTVATSGRFTVDTRITVPWIRSLRIDRWLTDQASHSYVAALDEQARIELLANLRAILERRFPTGELAVHYETWLWIGSRT